ncbi:histidine phosphatase family protein [Azospirillum sp. ST 5-10]|uniref:histidine phosphatase family protein n=1 Tax=unclassified Azospirillum TaxID=2630922 RepID=UPI003F49BB75
MLNAVLFCRHGETESNVGGWLAGSRDVALTARGRAQAEDAGRRLAAAGVRVPAIHTSPQRRARDTAAILARWLGCPVSVAVGLEERNWGELEGKALPADLLRERVPGGESLAAFRARVAAALDRLPGDGAGPPPLVVAHAGTWQALCWWLGRDPGTALPPNATPLLLTRAPAPASPSAAGDPLPPRPRDME